MASGLVRNTHTVLQVGADVDVQIAMTLESLFQQHDLLHALDPPALGLLLALAVALQLIQPDHLFDAILVLLFYAELEFELGQHELDAWAEVRCFGFYEIYNMSALQRAAVMRDLTHQACCSLDELGDPEVRVREEGRVRGWASCPGSGRHCSHRDRSYRGRCRMRGHWQEGRCRGALVAGHCVRGQSGRR